MCSSLNSLQRKRLKSSQNYHKFLQNYKKLSYTKYFYFYKHICPAIYRAQKYVNKNLIGRVQYYVYKFQNKIHVINLVFKTYNFMHLCGIKYFRNDHDLYRAFFFNNKRSYNGAHDFWYDFWNGHLNLNRVYFNRKYSKSKLRVIGDLPMLSNLEAIAVSKGGIQLKLKYIKAIRTRKDIMSLMLGHNRTSAYYPKSLWNLKRKPLHSKTLPIVAILSRDLSDENYQQVKIIHNVDSMSNNEFNNILTKIKEFQL